MQVPNTTQKTQSRAKDVQNGSRHVATPAMMMETLWMSRLSVHGMSARAPAATRPNVLQIPIIEIRKAAWVSGTPTVSANTVVYINGVKNPETSI